MKFTIHEKNIISPLITRIKAKFYILLLSLFVMSFRFPPVLHHQLGLPHYLYSEKYPQIPTMVIEADAEGYIVTFSIFPGNPRPGDIVRIKTYIKHKLSKEVYTKPIEMSVSRVTFLGGDTEILEPRFVSSDYNEYKMSYQFEEAEKYFINVTFEPRSDFYEKIPFPIVIGKTNFNIIPIIFGAVFFLIFIGVGFTKKRQLKTG